MAHDGHAPAARSLSFHQLVGHAFAYHTVLSIWLTSTPHREFIRATLLLILLQAGILPRVSQCWKGEEMRAFSTGLMAVSLMAATQPANAQNYGPAYEYALRCFVVNSAAGDDANARRAFDAATRLGQLQNLSNRQVNADLDRWTATEMVRIARDRRYRDQLLGECRRLGMAA